MAFQTLGCPFAHDIVAAQWSSFLMLHLQPLELILDGEVAHHLGWTMFGVRVVAEEGRKKDRTIP
jgi:hypothetical protein